MNIIIETPTKARIVNYTPEELENVRKALTYNNSSIAFQLQKHRANWRLKNRNLVYWGIREAELEAQVKTTLVFEDKDGLWLRTGSLPYLKGINVISNQIDYPAPKPLPWKKQMGFELYPYQSNSIENLLIEKHGHIELPTGAGKSAILLVLARALGGNGVVVATPSQSIFSELLAEFTDKLGEKYVGGYGDGKKDIKKPITIAIGKSLSMLKEGTPAYEFFKNKKAILVDEAHQWASETLDVTCNGVFSETPYRLFVTATVARGDGGLKLLESIVGKRVYEMSLEDAIKNEYLCPLKVKVITTISPETYTTKDPLECKRVHFLYNKNIAKIVATLANANWNIKKQSTLILVEELKQIKILKDLINVPMGYVHAGSKKEAAEYGLEQVDSQEQVLAFNEGKIKVLIGTRAIATGTNMFPTHYTVNWAGGSSEVVTKQGAMGRSTRKLEKSKFKELHNPKPYSQIWDFHVKDQPILHSQLKKRISFYEETGEKVEWV
jgi:superfamily II DNA or RNA helicase